jgi:putative transposase
MFFVVKLETREVHIAGIRVNPDGAWMKQIARNLTDPIDDFLRDATHIIHDADPLFTADFKAILKPVSYADSDGVTCVKIPPKSPNCNPLAERFVRTIKDECLRHFVFFGQRHLRYVRLSRRRDVRLLAIRVASIDHRKAHATFASTKP